VAGHGLPDADAPRTRRGIGAAAGVSSGRHAVGSSAALVRLAGLRSNPPPPETARPPPSAAAARMARTVRRARHRLPLAPAPGARAPRAAARGPCPSTLVLRVRRRQHRHRGEHGHRPPPAPSRARHGTSHPQVTPRERDGIRDRPPPGASYATSTGVKARASTTTGSGVRSDQTSGPQGDRTGQTGRARANGGGDDDVRRRRHCRSTGLERKTTAWASVTTKRQTQPARRSGGQAQGAGVAM